MSKEDRFPENGGKKTSRFGGFFKRVLGGGQESNLPAQPPEIDDFTDIQPDMPIINEHQDLESDAEFDFAADDEDKVVPSEDVVAPDDEFEPEYAEPFKEPAASPEASPEAEQVLAQWEYACRVAVNNLNGLHGSAQGLSELSADLFEKDWTPVAESMTVTLLRKSEQLQKLPSDRANITLAERLTDILVLIDEITQLFQEIQSGETDHSEIQDRLGDLANRAYAVNITKA